MVVASYCYGNAQELGIRFGNVSAGNVAIDAVFATGDFNRLHADVSIGNGIGIDLLWDFLYRPLGDEAFNWYVGAGPYVQLANPFWLGAVGKVGIEYHFNSVPICIGN